MGLWYVGRSPFTCRVRRSLAGTFFLLPMVQFSHRLCCVFLFVGTAPVIDPARNHVFVADRNNHRVVCFRIVDWTRVWQFGENGKCGNSNTTLDFPSGMALDASATQLFVCDNQSHRIVVLNAADGKFVRAWGSRGTGDGEFQHPTGICVSFPVGGPAAVAPPAAAAAAAGADPPRAAAAVVGQFVVAVTDKGALGIHQRVGSIGYSF
jgi:hypothetical protein